MPQDTLLPPFTSKTQWRRWLLSRRKSLTHEDVRGQSKRITQRFLNAFTPEKIHHLGLYHSFNNEVCTHFLAQTLQTYCVQLHYPVITGEHSMRFYPNTLATKTNKLGIKEPTVNNTPTNPNALNALIIPLVGFDKKGFRIGMGKGFYDYFLKHNPPPKNTPIIGWAYNFQKIQDCYPQSWDIRLDYVITPSSIYCFQQK